MANPTASEITVAGCRINVLRAGQGAPVLYLHGAGGLEWFPGLTDLSARYEIIAPEHPGFGKSEMPDWLDTMGDLSFFYLDVLDALNLHDVHVMGHSMGGWLAAEMAIRNTLRIKSLTLIAAAGLRVDGAEVGDFFMWPPEQIIRNLYLDQRHADEILATPPSEAELAVRLRNFATCAQLAWKPRLHNPHLVKWLHRIDVPTLILWGDSDKIIPAAHGDAYKRHIAGARLQIFPRCGHIPMVEARAGATAAITQFLSETAP